MVSVVCVHSALSLKDGRNSTQLPGRFVAEIVWQAWCKRVNNLGMPGGLLRSGAKGVADPGQADARRVLAFPSASTGAFVGLLAGWAFNATNEGGFKLDAQRKNLVAFLEAPFGFGGEGGESGLE